MSIQLQLRHDTAANWSSVVIAQGECVVDTTNNRILIGDGATAGGWPAAKLAETVLDTASSNVLAVGANGGNIQFSVLEFLTGTLSGTSYTCLTQLPSPCLIFAVGARVVTTITGSGSPTGFNIGDQASQGDGSASATRFANGVGLSAGSTSVGIAGQPFYNYAATNILLAPSGGSSPSFTGGTVRLSIKYASFGAPTS